MGDGAALDLGRPPGQPGAGGRHVVYAFWHNRMLAFVHTHRHRGVTVMISRHGDGEIIARAVERFGFRSVRGSSTRGGRGALKGLIDAAAGGDVAVTPDGPKGPRYVAQAGAVLIASVTGHPIVYGSAAADRAWRFRSWDRFLLPKPFARVVVRIEPPYAVPRDLDAAGLEAARRDLERRLRRVTAELDRAVTGEVDPILVEPESAAPAPAPEAGPAASPA